MRKIAPLFTLLAFAPFIAHAAEVMRPAAAPLGLDGLAMVSGDIKPATDIKNSGGASVSRRQLGYEIIGTGDVTHSTHLDLDYEFKYTDNRFAGGVAPYGDTQSHFFGAKMGTMFNVHYGAGLVTAVELAAENRADLLGDGLRGGIGPTFLWKPSKSFSTETGVTIQTQFGQDATLSPYIKWIYTPCASCALELRATGLQNGVVGTWYVTENKATSVKVSLFYETALYALRDGVAAGGFNVGEVPLRVTVTQFLTESFFVSARAEAILSHTENFYAGGNKVASLKTNPGASFGLVAGVRF